MKFHITETGQAISGGIGYFQCVIHIQDDKYKMTLHVSWIESENLPWVRLIDFTNDDRADCFVERFILKDVNPIFYIFSTQTWHSKCTFSTKNMEQKVERGILQLNRMWNKEFLKPIALTCATFSTNSEDICLDTAIDLLSPDVRIRTISELYHKSEK